MDNGMVEHRYRALRNHLDALGYRYPLAPESLPLVERLVSDLLHTTERLRHYKEVAQKSLEDCRNLEVGVEPYKHDNARLVQECNDLHLKLLHQQEDADRDQKDLKLRVRKLESDNSDLQFLSSQHLARIKVLEQESAQKTRKIVQLQGITVISSHDRKKNTLSTKPQATFELDSPLKPGKSGQEQLNSLSAQTRNPYVANMMELADQQISNLNRELNILKEQKIQEASVLATLKDKVENREREIQRLRDMLEGGRPIGAIRRDCRCTCKDKTHQLNTLTNEIGVLEQRNKDLEKQVEESVSSQHEAMTRAVMLADRNKQLEKELHDIDQMALAVEAQCSSTLEENTARVSKMQVQMENNLKQIHRLEQEVLKLERNNQEQQASIERMRSEKHQLQRKLESALDDKKNSDRINELTIIERDLNKEIERLIEETTLQKRRIADLEIKLASRATDLGTVPGESQKKVHPEKMPKSKTSLRGQKDKRDGSVRKSSTSSENGVKLNPEQYEALIEKLQSERDFYYSECYRLKEQRSVTASCANCAELRCKLSKKEQELQELRQANRELMRQKEIPRSLPRRETHSVMTSPSYIYPGTDPASGMSWADVAKHFEQERDLARDNIGRLEEERNTLRERLKIATETQVTEHARHERTTTKSEDTLRRLEAERRELLASEGAHKATVTNLQSQIESLQSQLFTAQSELTQQRVLYNQIKTLQEQTDRALADSQAKVIQTEMELTNCQEREKELEKDRAKLDKEVVRLKNEVSVMRGTLAQVDQEKDGLLISIDNKTERAATLEQELKAKEDRLLKTEEALTEARKKLSTAMEDIASRDSKARSSEQDAKNLQHDLKMMEQARESTLAENRLLHSDLANLTEDLRRANSDLESSRREVENLKHQLQEYVSEVRRVEELLARKEGERSEMLDHFRSLSMEASVLESNNHSLETEVQDSRIQLRIANDRITDLEHLLETKDTLVNSCEHQIAELSANIARLETQIHEENAQRHRSEEDLGVVRDLCTKLDAQKDTLLQQVNENGLIKMQLETELTKLRDEREALLEKLTKGHESVATLENLLSSSRKETLDQKLSHQETEGELKSLHHKLADMKEKLDKVSADLQQSQLKVVELTRQISELQRSVTNERFERARLEEECRRTITLSDSQGSSPSRADIQDLNFGNTDDEDRASSSTDL